MPAPVSAPEVVAVSAPEVVAVAAPEVVAVAAPEVAAVAAPEVAALAAPVQVPAMTPASQVLAGRVVWMAAVAEYYVTDPTRQPRTPAATLPALDASRAAARVRCQGYAGALQADLSLGVGAAI